MFSAGLNPKAAQTQALFEEEVPRDTRVLELPQSTTSYCVWRFIIVLSRFEGGTLQKPPDGGLLSPSAMQPGVRMRLLCCADRRARRVHPINDGTSD